MSLSAPLTTHKIFSDDNVKNINLPLPSSGKLASDRCSSNSESSLRPARNITSTSPKDITSKKNGNRHRKFNLFYCNCYSKKSLRKKSSGKSTHFETSVGERSPVANNSSSDKENFSASSEKADDDQNTKEDLASSSATFSRIKTLWEGRKSGKFKIPFRKSIEKSDTCADTSICSRDNPDSTVFIKPVSSLDSSDAVTNDSSLHIIEINKQKSSTLLGPALQRDCNKKCFIIDLDETLVHSSFKAVDRADFRVGVEIDGVIHQVYVLKRPYVDEFLEAVGDIYECVLFTASLSKYADPVADFLDKHKVFRYRLFREACVFHHGNYVKDLSQLGRPIDQVVILDNSPASYMFHATHAIQITSWFDDMSDRALLELIPYFQRLSSEPNVVEFLRHNPPPSKYAVVGSFDVNLLNSLAYTTTSRSPLGNTIMSRVARPLQSLSSVDTSSSSNSVRREIFSTALLSTTPDPSPSVFRSIPPNDKKSSPALESSNNEHFFVADNNSVPNPASNFTDQLTNSMRRGIFSTAPTLPAHTPPSTSSASPTTDKQASLVLKSSMDTPARTEINSVHPSCSHFPGQTALPSTFRSFLRSSPTRPVSTPSRSDSNYSRSALRACNLSAPVTPKSLSQPPRKLTQTQNPTDLKSPVHSSNYTSKSSHSDA